MKENTFSCLRLGDFPAYKSVVQQAWFAPADVKPLKLDWNESPIPPSPRVRQAVFDFLARPNALNWYPDANSTQLRHTIAHHWQVSEDSVQTYCGSDTALEYAVRIFTQKSDTVLMVSPTYDNFRIYALEAECSVVQDGPEDIFELKAEGLDAMIRQHRPRLVYVANPNNPTGWLMMPQELEAVAVHHPGTLLLVDEAYGEFAGKSAIHLAATRANMIVFRSFSKAYGLAGLRVGYVIASPGNVEQLSRVRNGKNVSMIGQVAAIAAMEDQEFLRETLRHIEDGQRRLAAGLNDLNIPFRVTPGNFVLIKVENAAEVQSELAKRFVYVRSVAHLKGMQGYLRITLGDSEQMCQFVETLKSILRG
jgi:histidinol-phosphate aminotransferase